MPRFLLLLAALLVSLPTDAQDKKKPPPKIEPRVLLAVPLVLRKDRARFARSMAFALTPLLLWTLLISTRAGHLIPLMEGSDFRFKLGNNPNATGYSFPYPEIGSPSGWEFLLHRPGNEIRLIGHVRFDWLTRIFEQI